MHISAELNEKMTRVGAGTPMGKTFGRYRLPAALTTDLTEPDSPPIRVRVMGENLVAFRDSASDGGCSIGVTSS